MEFFKMNLYTLYRNNGVFKNRRDKQTRMALVNKSIQLTLKDGISILNDYTMEELEQIVFEL